MCITRGTDRTERCRTLCSNLSQGCSKVSDMGLYRKGCEVGGGGVRGVGGWGSVLRAVMYLMRSRANTPGAVLCRERRR